MSSNPEVEALAGKMIEAVRGFVAKAEAGFNSRLDALETRLKAIPSGEKGEKGDAGENGQDGAAGKDGVPGVDGKDADPEVIRAEVAKAVALVPKAIDGKEGANGKDGRDGEKGIDGVPGRDGRDGLPGLNGKDAAPGKDGFSLEDFDMEISEDGRTLSLKFVRGEVKVEKQIKLATLIYREVWREGEYEHGDVCTWGGSAWHCQRKTAEKPAYGCKDWKLMVKEGRPGKDGVVTTPPERKPVRTA